ncbi:YfjI family protein [Falsochrobactrum ovis]|uniref:Uncharacterized protein DUF3987 n=1 Tax=Falsochrobactrum ovis TaxID=1293442 RepID=A0A364JT55_9HYPH|nr:YfjI family protein [Falsochrobactrum ovis]RAK26795.1 uncharacterized protein DUF3987 [Falsochrobactrum ovis]
MNIPVPSPFKCEGAQPLVREIAAPSEYPQHALSGLLKAVLAVQGATQAPLAISAQSALTISSLALQGFANVEKLRGDCPISLYGLTIAQSGERKTSVDSYFMQGIRDHEQEQADEQRTALNQWKIEHDIWEAKRKSYLAEVKGSISDKAQAAQANLESLGAEPDMPPSKERVVTEPTYEGLVRKFHEGQPSLGVFSDEGGQFLGGYAMGKDNRQKTLAAFNDLWQGNPIRRDRAGDGSFVLFGRRLAIHLMIQPSVARQFMADPMTDDTGFLPRFLISEPESTIGTRLYSKSQYDPKPIEAFTLRLKQILETPLPMDEKTRALNPRLLKLSEDARGVLIQFADRIETAMQKGGKYAHITGYASKAAEQAARIAGVLTLWDDLEAKEVSGINMVHGTTLAEFYLDEALRLSDAAVISQETANAEELRKWLIEKWQHAEILPNEVVQFAPKRSMRERPTANKAIKVLVEYGWLIPLEKGVFIRDKARKEAYRIVRN